MRDAGIEVVQALEVSPWRIFLRRLDLRQHRKIIVIDDEIAYISSMNMVDPAYFKQNAGVGQWIDIMVRVTGPTVNVLSAIHCWDWEFETYHACCRKSGMPPRTESASASNPSCPFWPWYA